ncbi:unnamed protein product, partial [Aureobasidium uvarum]
TDNMDDLCQLDESIFQEDESLVDRMERLKPRFDMTNASLTSICGHPRISIHSQDDKASREETIMFNLLIELINVSDQEYDRSTAASAAAHATNALFISMTPDPSRRQTEKYSYGALWTIYSELFNFIKQIPVEHHAMQRLVDWVAELRKIHVQTLHIWGKDIELWKGLPLLNPEWVELCQEYCGPREVMLSRRFRTFRDLLESSGGYTLYNYWK